jgi:hypothetical protein
MSRSESGIFMAWKRTGVRKIVAELSIFLLGIVLALCSMPIFTFTRDEIQEFQKSETIMDGSFNVHQSQDKIVQVQLSIGQKIGVLATGSASFNFSIVNFTSTAHAIQADQPDVVYLFLNDTVSVNTTWSPEVRSADPGNYYLVFLARNVSSDFPVQINANVTKTWTDYRIVPVVASDRRPLIDPNFLYIGSGTAVFGTVISLAAFYHERRSKKHRR